MSLKLLSAILVAVYSATTLVTHPFQSAYALRTPSVKCSSAGNEDGIAGELTDQQGDKGPFSVTAACWKEFLALQDNGYRSAPLWDKFALATETVDDVNFLNAVFGRFTEYLPGLVKQGVERSVQRARELLPAMEKAPPKADRKTVNIVATEDGFTEGPSSIAAPAAAAFNIPAPDAPPEKWDECINGVKSKAEFAVIKEAFKACTLPPKEKGNVAGMFTIATFWVDKGCNPKTHKSFEEIEPSPAVPVQTKPAGLSDKALAKLGVPAKDIKSRTSNESGDEAIITRTADGQPQLFVVKANGELLTKGLLFSSDTGLKFFIFGADGKLSRLRLENLQILTIMDPKVTSDTCDMHLSPDGNLFLLYFKGQDMVYVYKIDAEDFTNPYRQFNNPGRPTRISFSPDSKLAVFGFAGDREELLVDIEANRVASVESTEAPAADASAAADEIRRRIKDKQRLVAPSDIRSWLELAEKIKPPDLELFDDILAALDRSSQILQDGRPGLSKAIAEAKERASAVAKGKTLTEAARAAAEAAGITLVSRGSGKKAAERLRPEAKGLDEIRLKEETPKPAPAPPAETPESVLEQAKKKIALAKSDKGLESVLLQFLQHELIKDSEELKEELNAAAKKRQAELETLCIISLRLDAAFNSGTVHLEQEYSLAQANGAVKKSIEGCLKESYGIFKAAAEPEKIFEGLGIDKDSAFFKEAKELITKKQRLFKVWASLAIKAESADLNATTFSELKALADELKARFGSSAECLAVPKVLIEKRRAILEEKQKATIENIKPIAAIVVQEYAWLIKHFDEFKEALKNLEAEAKKAKFDSLKHAADEAVDDLYKKVQTAGGRLETQRMVYSGKWRRWWRLRPLKKPLREVVAKRKSLIGQLKLYLEAKRAILDNFKPQDFALAENEKGKLAELVDAAVVEIMKDRNMKQDYPGIAEQYLYNKAYRFRGIAKLIADSDRIYLYHLCRKLGIKEKDFKAITNETFSIAGTVDLAKFMERHSPAFPAAQTAALEKKFLLAIDSRA